MRYYDRADLDTNAKYYIMVGGRNSGRRYFMENDILARLMLEKVELEKRLDKLVAFIEGSENFQNLGTIDKTLLLNQKDAMVRYLEVLTTRLDRATTRKS